MASPVILRYYSGGPEVKTHTYPGQPSQAGSHSALQPSAPKPGPLPITIALMVPGRQGLLQRRLQGWLS